MAVPYYVDKKNKKLIQMGTGPSLIFPRNLGELVFSLLPLYDASLHLADGALISMRGYYAKCVEDIIKIYNLIPDASCWTTEEDWQQSVNKYGVCGKWVVNPGSLTVRLPKVTGFVEGTIDPAALGQLTEAGLPNIIASSLGLVVTDREVGEVDGAAATFEKSLEDISIATAESEGAKLYSTGVNASLSSSLYRDDVTTVQPQTIKGYVYICLLPHLSTIAEDIRADIEKLGDSVEVINKRAEDAYEKAEAAYVLNTGNVVVEKWESEDGNSWYRKWSDGYIEQGGRCLGSFGQTSTVTFIKPFERVVFGVHAMWNNNPSTSCEQISVSNYSLENFDFILYANNSGSGYSGADIAWTSKGY